jgi:hypothetical protein
MKTLEQIGLWCLHSYMKGRACVARLGRKATISSQVGPSGEYNYIRACVGMARQVRNDLKTERSSYV